jgi:hypothetical protein
MPSPNRPDQPEDFGGQADGRAPSDDVDEALDETFPASDPSATWAGDDEEEQTPPSTIFRGDRGQKGEERRPQA